MGRDEKEKLLTSQLMYPCMQCADIFFLKADICQLGLDQRKVNMLAREYCHFNNRQQPVIVSHRMLSGLKRDEPKPEKEDEQLTEEEKKDKFIGKMSKSDPNSAIFMEDSEKEVKEKINKSFCWDPLEVRKKIKEEMSKNPEFVPPKEDFVTNNTILEYARYIIFAKLGHFKLTRAAQHGGNKTFEKYEDLEKAYLSEEVHPGDLKNSISTQINNILQPIRDHFKNNPEAKKLLELVRSFHVTR